MIAIDANIFLEVILKQDKFEECKEFLKLVNEGKLKAIVSAFTVDAILLAMERKKMSQDDMKNFVLSLMKYKELYNYPNQNPEKMWAVEFMKKYNLDFEDALTLECALQSECKEIVSLDKHFNRVTEIKRLTPKE